MSYEPTRSSRPRRSNQQAMVVKVSCPAQPSSPATLFQFRDETRSPHIFLSFAFIPYHFLHGLYTVKSAGCCTECCTISPRNDYASNHFLQL